MEPIQWVILPKLPAPVKPTPTLSDLKLRKTVGGYLGVFNCEQVDKHTETVLEVSLEISTTERAELYILLVFTQPIPPMIAVPQLSPAVVTMFLTWL